MRATSGKDPQSCVITPDFGGPIGVQPKVGVDIEIVPFAFEPLQPPNV